MSHQTKQARDSDDLPSLRSLIEEAPLLAEAVVDTVRESVLLLDGGLRVILANRSFYITFGVEPSETLDRLVYELGDGLWNIPELRNLLERILPHNSSFRDFEVPLTVPGIGRKVTLLNARKLRRRDQTELILLTIDDITAVRHRNEGDRYTAVMFRSSGEALIGLSADGIIRSWNPAAERLYGFSVEEAVGCPISILVPPEFQAEQEDFLHRLREGNSVTAETVRVAKNGRRVMVIVTAAPVFDDARRLIGISAAHTDISERKEMEDSLRDREQELAQLVREKEVLVQEVHHRVKNNLQTIASLLSIHSGYMDSQPAVTALSEAGVRVQAIARLHEKLYATQSLADINFGDYLRAVSQDLKNLHGCPEITLSVVCDDIVMDMERATPLGLLANELIVNSLKHGFPKGRAGHVGVSFEYVRDSVPEGEPLDNSLVSLRVEDNGVGVPSGQKIDELRSMGLDLVRLLSHQLDATCEFQTVEGVKCIITFPLRRVS